MKISSIAFRSIFLLVFLSQFSFIPLTSAQSATFSVLPGTELDHEQCQSLMDQFVIDQKIPSSAQVNDASEVQDIEQKFISEEHKKFLAEESLQNSQSELTNAQKTFDACNKEASCEKKAKTSLDAATSGHKKVQSEFDQVKQTYNTVSLQRKNLQDKYGSKYANLANTADTNISNLSSMRQNLLGCAIKTGRISLNMIPYFITYIINFALGFVGLISLLFVVIGGYHYVIGGFGGDQEKGKNTIKNALIGMGVALLSWSVVNVIIQVLTS